MTCRAFLLLLAALAPLAHADESCMADLEAVAPYLLANDAGARDHVARKGQAVFDAALATARRGAAAAGTGDACVEVLRNYLLTYRRGHLAIRPPRTTPGTIARPVPQPAFRVLSAQTALLVLPTFVDDAGAQIRALLEQHAAEIAARRNLVIDIRGNGGGSDWTYEPVLALVDANIRRNVGTEFLATPANIEATEKACDVYAVASPKCREFMLKTAAAMRSVRSGVYVRLPDEPPVEIVSPAKVAEHPRFVALLVDQRCASSCEEFVVTVRQSWKVKLFGQSTAGVLDYSNMRPYVLPSGRWLLYATSRSLRLPAFPVDGTGIPPDQVLPRPPDDAGREAELREVVKVIESAR